MENHGKIGMSMEFPWRWSPVFLVKTVLNHPPFTETRPSSFQETPRFMLDPVNKDSGSLLVENPKEMIQKKHVEHKENILEMHCLALAVEHKLLSAMIDAISLKDPQKYRFLWPMSPTFWPKILGSESWMNPYDHTHGVLMRHAPGNLSAGDRRWHWSQRCDSKRQSLRG